MIPRRSRCVPRHVQCSTEHAELVRDYQRERARQFEFALEASAGYDTEYREYVEKYPLITFKVWLLGSRKEPELVEYQEVKVGQVWRDCAPRANGRRITIRSTDASHAIVTGESGRTTRIRLDRFRPGSTGFELMEEPQ